MAIHEGHQNAARVPGRGACRGAIEGCGGGLAIEHWRGERGCQATENAEGGHGGVRLAGGKPDTGAEGGGDRRGKRPRGHVVERQRAVERPTFLGQQQRVGPTVCGVDEFDTGSGSIVAPHHTERIEHHAVVLRLGVGDHPYAAIPCIGECRLGIEFAGRGWAVENGDRRGRIGIRHRPAVGVGSLRPERVDLLAFDIGQDQHGPGNRSLGSRITRIEDAGIGMGIADTGNEQLLLIKGDHGPAELAEIGQAGSAPARFPGREERRDGHSHSSQTNAENGEQFHPRDACAARARGLAGGRPIHGGSVRAKGMARTEAFFRWSWGLTEQKYPLHACSINPHEDPSSPSVQMSSDKSIAGGLGLARGGGWGAGSPQQKTARGCPRAVSLVAGPDGDSLSVIGSRPQRGELRAGSCLIPPRSAWPRLLLRCQKPENLT